MKITTKFRRILLYLASFTTLILIFLIYSTTKDRFNNAVPVPLPSPPEIKHRYLHTNVLKHLNILAPKGSKPYIDYQLNLRKLTLFAVHELNKYVSDSPSNSCGQNCPKWWANHLKTTNLTSWCSEEEDFCEHEITFMGEPGPVQFSTVIQQNQYSSDTILEEFEELKIISNFTRVPDAHAYAYAHSKIVPAADAPPTVLNEDALISYNTKDNEIDPELYSWKRHYSFLVGDYVDFKAPIGSLYPISPGERQKGLAEETYCGSALKMLIMVSSAPPHFENRRIIRETYGAEKHLLAQQVRLVFLFGRVTNETLQTKLEEEAAEHDDLIQADFMDSYHNLSLSHLLMYNWVQRTCETVGLPRYVFKADDDFFLNVDLALKVAYSNPQYELIGTLYCGTPPVRHVAYMTKYYTPRYMYSADMYVGYLSGVAYLLRTDIIPRMLKISLTTPMIHMDDVYMTGMLPRQLDFLPSGSKLFNYARVEPDPCSMKKMACSSVIDMPDLLLQYNEWAKPIPSNCSLNGTYERLEIQPLRPYDVTGCIFEYKEPEPTNSVPELVIESNGT